MKANRQGNDIFREIMGGKKVNREFYIQGNYASKIKVKLEHY